MLELLIVQYVKGAFINSFLKQLFIQCLLWASSSGWSWYFCGIRSLLKNALSHFLGSRVETPKSQGADNLVGGQTKWQCLLQASGSITLSMARKMAQVVQPSPSPSLETIRYLEVDGGWSHGRVERSKVQWHKVSKPEVLHWRPEKSVVAWETVYFTVFVTVAPEDGHQESRANIPWCDQWCWRDFVFCQRNSIGISGKHWEVGELWVSSLCKRSRAK